MNSTDEIIEVLNDLLKINNDRTEEYEKRASQVENDETTLKGIFYQLAEESREFSTQLSEKVRELSGGSNGIEKTGAGKIYRAWMDEEVIFSGSDALAVLGSCDFGEEAAQRAYKEAIEAGRDFPNDVRRLIMNQKDMIGLSHNLIRSQRDHHEMATHMTSARENK